MENGKEDKKHYYGHRERLRMRFLENPDSLSNYECLELLLGYAVPRGDTKPLAKTMLDKSGGKIFPVFDNPEHFAGKQLSSYQCALLKLVRHIVTRGLREELDAEDILAKPETVADWVKMLFMESPNERFLVLFLNSKNNVIAHEFHSEGTLAQTAVYPRRIIERALEKRASALILAHNHPSGDPEPSADDIRLTRQIRSAAELFTIRLLDHLIVGRNTYYSMLREGDI